MTVYDVRLADGRIVTIAGTDPETVCVRAVDLYRSACVAWRNQTGQGTVSVLGPNGRIIG